MSFWSKVVKVGASLVEAAGDNAKSYEHDAHRIAKEQERKMRNVNYDRLTSEQKEKYRSRMDNIERLKNVDRSEFVESEKRKASSLSSYAENLEKKEDDY